MSDVVQFPQRVELELSAVCNLRCSYCPRRFVDGLGGFMEPGLFRRLIDEISAHPGRVVVLHRRGESLLHPQFADLLEYCAGKFAEVQLATNATAMDREKAEAMAATLDFVSFSLDVPERLKTVRGADWEQVRENIEFFLSCNKRARTQVSMVQTEDVTEADIQRFHAIWQGKVDRIRVYPEHSSGGKFGALRDKRPQRRPCTMPSYEVVILSDGQVARCNHDWNGSPMGDVSARSISDVWHSPLYQELRRQQASLDIQDQTCAACDSWYPEMGEQGTGRTWEDQR